MAKSKVFSLGTNNPLIALTDPKEIEKTTTAKSLINTYYINCINGSEDKNPIMKENVQLQCACTAATASEIMDKDNMMTIFSDSPYRHFMIGRLMEYAYIPCMTTSLRNIIKDNCTQNPAVGGRLKHGDEVCGCIADGITDHSVEKGKNVIPGFYRKVLFDPDKSPDNPLAHIISTKNFKRMHDAYMKTCVRRHELGW